MIPLTNTTSSDTRCPETTYSSTGKERSFTLHKGGNQRESPVCCETGRVYGFSTCETWMRWERVDER